MKVPKKQQNNWWQPSLILFTRLSGWIVGPIVLALFIGRWLDNKYKTEPWFFLLLVGIAFILSSIGIVKEAGEGMRQIEKDLKDKKSKE